MRTRLGSLVVACILMVGAFCWTVQADVHNPGATWTAIVSWVTGNFLGISAKAADSELLDGEHGSAFAKLAGNQTVGGTNYFSGGTNSFAGWVGIGTTTPAAKLVVRGNAQVSPVQSTIFLEDASGGGTDRDWGIGNALGDSYGSLYFQVGASSGASPIGGGHLHPLELTRGGNAIFNYSVGIGTNTPAAKLHVVGNLICVTNFLYYASATNCSGIWMDANNQYVFKIKLGVYTCLTNAIP